MTMTSPNIGTLKHLQSSPWLDLLSHRLDGELITRTSSQYDDVRQIHDITVDRYPLAVVRAATAGDVARAILFARGNSLPLVVRSGGHSLAGHSMADGGLVIDVSQMKGISIDPVAQTARVQSGANSGELAALAGKHGLALTTGDTESVGFGGLTTGGGIGFMARKYGLTIDHLISAEVVTAAGEIVTASETEHPDLFWAIRGGGGNFGVITEFTFRLTAVAQILGGDLILPATREVIRGYLEYTVSAPDELSTIGNLMRVAPVPFVPEELVGQLAFVVIVAWAGDIEEGERALAPLRALATPLADTVRPMPYSSIYLSTAHQAFRHAVALRSMFTDEFSDETLDAALEAIEHASSPFSLIHFRGLGGEMSRVPVDATAFAHRNRRYLLGIIGVWLDAAEDEALHQAWVTSLWEKVRHEGQGVYVNFLTNEGKDRIHDAYPPETLERLRTIKRFYDPYNLFQSNQNIAPALLGPA